MITTSEKFPSFSMQGVVSNDMSQAFQEFTEKSFPNKWLILFSWPKDFTFVCPTEIAAFGDLNEEFSERDAQVLGFSTDSEFVHLAWRREKKEINDLPFPMLSDISRKLSLELGILDEQEGVAKRATYIVDPHGIIRFVMVNDMQVGRNPQEVLRVLDALQTDELCPCNWHKGDETIDIDDK